MAEGTLVWWRQTLELKAANTGARLVEFYVSRPSERKSSWQVWAAIRRPMGPRDQPFGPTTRRPVWRQAQIDAADQAKLERRSRGVEIGTQTVESEAPPTEGQFMRSLHAEERRLNREACLRLVRQERLPAWTDSAENYGQRMVNYLKFWRAISGRVYSAQPTLIDQELLVTLWFEVPQTEGLEWEAEARGRSLEEVWEQWNAAEARRVEERGHAPLTEN